MKTILKIAAATLLLFSISACSKQQRGSMQIINIEVPYTSWEYSISLTEEEDPELKYSGNFYKATVPMPEITRDVYEGGMIKMYRVFTSDGVQAEMPYHVQREFYDVDTETRYFYTEAIDYEFTVGKINVFYSESDFNYEDFPEFIPDAMNFRCVIIQ